MIIISLFTVLIFGQLTPLLLTHASTTARRRRLPVHLSTSWPIGRLLPDANSIWKLSSTSEWKLTQSAPLLAKYCLKVEACVLIRSNSNSNFLSELRVILNNVLHVSYLKCFYLLYKRPGEPFFVDHPSLHRSIYLLQNYMCMQLWSSLRKLWPCYR